MIGISEKSINFKTTLPIKIIYCGNPEFIMFYRKFSPVICKHFLLMKPFTVDSYQEVGYIKQQKQQSYIRVGPASYSLPLLAHLPYGALKDIHYLTPGTQGKASIPAETIGLQLHFS